MAGPKIPVYHPNKGGGSTTTKSSSTTTKSSSSSSSSKPHTTNLGVKSKSNGGGGGGGGSKNHAHAKAKKKGIESKTPEGKATNKYIQQANSMTGQINALKHSLGSQGFAAALKQRLANIGLVVGQQDKILLDGYNDRLASLTDSSKDNDRAVGDATQQNVANRARERSNAVSEAMNQGAGESDVLRSQLASLRSFDSNQQDINRSYFDSRTGVQSSLRDLNADTKTARANMASQANADRDQVWSQYYDQRSETLTALGNAYGMQSQLYSEAKAIKGGKTAKKLQTAADVASGKAFMGASVANATVHANPGLPASIKDWTGTTEIKSSGVNTGQIQAAPTTVEVKKPEGATLRKWTT